MNETINPEIKFSVPYEGRYFLSLKGARFISIISTDTWTRRVYEIDTPDGTEVWIERESRLEAPEYFYQLFQFLGEPDAVTPSGRVR